jgi:hypothetical protein
MRETDIETERPPGATNTKAASDTLVPRNLGRLRDRAW